MTSRPRTRSPWLAAVGASFYGAAWRVTASACPGVVPKAETVGLAIALEPLLVILGYVLSARAVHRCRRKPGATC